MKKNIYNFLKNDKTITYLIIFFIALFICIPLFSKYMDISADDGIQHICRLIGTYDSLKEKNIFPVIMSKFCNNFGYSWNIFYSPLTAYLPLIFKIFTNSFVLCLKLFMFSTILLSGIYMHTLVYRISKSHKAGIISAIIYMSAPYHLTDLYNRIAVAELTSFMFLPIVFLGMYELFNKSKKHYYISIGAIGLILSHNVIAVYTAIFCFVYLLINYKKIDKSIVKKLIINVLIILLCTSFYWIPLIEHMLGTTYEVFVPERMYKDNTLIGSKLLLLDLSITKPYNMNFHIGIPIILGIIFLLIYYKRLKPRYRKLLMTFFTFGIVSILMTLKIFPFEYMPSFLKMIQFTWRMMEFAVFFLSIISGISITVFINSNNKKETIFVIFIIIYMLILLLTTKKEVAIPFDEKKYLTPTPVTSLTGRVHAGCATFEYLPKKALANRAYIENRTDTVCILDGSANIQNMYKENTKLNFDIENVNENTKLELPYIYYLGYEAKLKQEEKATKIPVKESDNGFCMIEISSKLDKGKIEVEYVGTALMKISYVLTLLGDIALIYIICKKSHNVI